MSLPERAKQIGNTSSQTFAKSWGTGGERCDVFLSPICIIHFRNSIGCYNRPHATILLYWRAMLSMSHPMLTLGHRRSLFANISTVSQALLSLLCAPATMISTRAVRPARKLHVGSVTLLH